MWESDPESLVDRLIMDFDESVMPMPSFESQPHLLISKVRKHYMEYMIKLLSVNYENHQKLVDKNIYLPSAIWRCAKNIELKAAQSCMVVQLYRKNILNVVKTLKDDTKKGKLHRDLYDCLHKPPENEKKSQVNMSRADECTCQCTCELRKRRCRISDLSHKDPNIIDIHTTVLPEVTNGYNEQYKIPVILNSQLLQESTITSQTTNKDSAVPCITQISNQSPKLCTMPAESQDSDELMMQLEKLFQADPNDEDIFDSTLGDSIDHFNSLEDIPSIQRQEPVIENHAAQIKSLDERLASLAGLIAGNTENNWNQNKVQKKSDQTKTKRHTNKWLCEEYYFKSRLFELLDQFGDNNRRKFDQVKDILYALFGEDSDDEGVVSPLEETPEYIASCKERIAPWVVKLLTPYYSRGRIRGKALFKSLAKHLISLIYQCSHYPNEFEVKSFVSDFLENHKMIRCEADFKMFKIDNI